MADTSYTCFGKFKLLRWSKSCWLKEVEGLEWSVGTCRWWRSEASNWRKSDCSRTISWMRGDWGWKGWSVLFPLVMTGGVSSNQQVAGIKRIEREWLWISWLFYLIAGSVWLTEAIRGYQSCHYGISSWSCYPELIWLDMHFIFHFLVCIFIFIYTHLFFTRVTQLIDKSCGPLKVSDLRRLTENKPGSLLPELIGTGEKWCVGTLLERIRGLESWNDLELVKWLLTLWCNFKKSSKLKHLGVVRKNSVPLELLHLPGRLERSPRVDLPNFSRKSLCWDWDLHWHGFSWFFMWNGWNIEQNSSCRAKRKGKSVMWVLFWVVVKNLCQAFKTSKRPSCLTKDREQQWFNITILVRPRAHWTSVDLHFGTL